MKTTQFNIDDSGQETLSHEFTQKRIDASDPDVKFRVPIEPELYPDDFDTEVVLLGGSFLIGSELNDEDTLPHYLQRRFNERLEKVRIRFVGRGGRGFSNMLKHLLDEDPIFLDLIGEKSAKHFYYFHPDFHTKRTYLNVGDLYYQEYKSQFPYFKVSPNSYEFAGSFEEAFPITVRTLFFMKRLHLLTPVTLEWLKKYLNWRDIRSIAPGYGFKQHVWLLNHFGNELKKRYPSSTFTVVEYPFYAHKDKDFWAPLTHPIHRFELSSNLLARKDTLLIKNDGHPSADFIKIIGPMEFDRILKDLGRNE
jgi:hypothetical protein